MILLAGPALSAEPAHLRVLDGVDLALHGFVDAGWYAVLGEPASYRYVGLRPGGVWAYAGDPWANPVNSQGDPADLGNDFNNLTRAGAVGSAGPTFLVNTVEQAVRVTGDRVGAEAAVWVEPRSGDLGDLGDRVSVDRAWISVRASPDVAIQLGKLESAFGAEWFRRRAPDRVTVTPSLVARYAVGTPVGLAVDLAPGDHVVVRAALTNTLPTTERIGHLGGEVDDNAFPAGAARVAVRGGPASLGLSGAAGAQDGQPSPIPAWQVGADAGLHGAGWYLEAEYLVTRQDGADPRAAAGVRAHGGSLLAWAFVRPWAAPFVRVDRRVGRLTAPVLSEVNRYDADVVRLSLGARFVPVYNLVLRAEWSHPWEPGSADEGAADDVLTASAVFRY